MKIYNFFSFFILLGQFTIAQTIINTENMMIDDQGKLSYALNFQGDLNFGNIDLIQIAQCLIHCFIFYLSNQ